MVSAKNGVDENGGYSFGHSFNQSINQSTMVSYTKIILLFALLQCIQAIWPPLTEKEEEDIRERLKYIYTVDESYFSFAQTPHSRFGFVANKDIPAGTLLLRANSSNVRKSLRKLLSPHYL